MAVTRRISLASMMVGLLACGARTELDAPGEPDAFVPAHDAGSIDAAVEPDAGDPTFAAIAITVTVGDDSLGDTDLLRPEVSEAFVFVRLDDGSDIEVDLNEGTTWSAYTTHRRDVAIPFPAEWSDVSSVGIRHEAAGNDWNADNWTMNEVVIAFVSESGRETERYRESGTPIWQFRKNDNQIWEHALE